MLKWSAMVIAYGKCTVPGCPSIIEH